MQQQDGSEVPDAMLLLAPSCPHCPLVLESLAQMVKLGQIGSLEVVNIVAHPERAQQLGVRSVPWFRIGPLQFEGVHSKQELQQWAAKAMAPSGQQDYIEQLLATGALPRALEFIGQEPLRDQLLIGLLEKPDTNINVRVGIGAIMEHLAENGGLTLLLSELGRLTQSSDARLRSDACYYLSLSASKSALPFIEVLIKDKDKEVQEIAIEARETLLQALQHS